MAILTAADLTELAPGIDQSQAGAIAGLLLRVQEWCEGSLGAGRPLELNQFTDIIPVAWTAAQYAQVPNVPIQATPTPVLEVRQGGPNAWNPLTESAYDLNLVNGQIELSLLTTGDLSYGFSDLHYANNFNSTHTTEIRATYTAGWDFSADFSASTDPVVRGIKSIAAELALFLWASAGGSNQYSAAALSSAAGIGTGPIKKEDIDDHYSVEYQNSGSSGTAVKSFANLAASGELKKMIGNILYPLKKYRPRAIAAYGV